MQAAPLLLLCLAPPVAPTIVATTPAAAQTEPGPAPAPAFSLPGVPAPPAANHRSPAGITVAGECRTDAVVEVNLTSWKAALRRTTDPVRRDELLGELKLSLDLGAAPAGGEGESAEDDTITPPPAGSVKLLGVDDFPVRLGPGDRPERVIYVRYQGERAGQKTTTHLVQVMRPLWGQTFCVLGSDLSRQDHRDSRLETYALDFVPLTSAKTKAVQVEAVEAGLRASETTRQYWLADGPRLRKVFEQTISGMENRAGGRTMARTGQLVLAGGFPKRIELKQSVKQASCDVSDGEAPCDGKEQLTSQVFVYDGRHYVRRGEAPRPAPVKLGP